MMTEHEQKITTARAVADRQIAHVRSTIDEVLIPGAARLLADKDPTDAWALLVHQVKEQLGDRPGFMAEMLAVMALERASDQPD